MLRLINFRQSEPTNPAFIRLSGHLAAITEDLAPRAIFIWYFRKTDGRGGGGGGAECERPCFQQKYSYKLNAMSC